MHATRLSGQPLEQERGQGWLNSAASARKTRPPKSKSCICLTARRRDAATAIDRLRLVAQPHRGVEQLRHVHVDRVQALAQPSTASGPRYVFAKRQQPFAADLLRGQGPSFDLWTCSFSLLLSHWSTPALLSLSSLLLPRSRTRAHGQSRPTGLTRRSHAVVGLVRGGRDWAHASSSCALDGGRG